MIYAARPKAKQRPACPSCNERTIFLTVTQKGIQLRCRSCNKTFSPEEILAKNGDSAEEVFGGLRCERF